jgi:ATP-dependent DNA helicase PIF1
MVDFSGYCTIHYDRASFMDCIFPDIGYTPNCENAILCPLNDAATEMNNSLIDKSPGISAYYTAVNTPIQDEDYSHFPIEFLNTLDFSCLPPHILRLKTGTPIITLRSIDKPILQNGTRCIVTRCHSNVIEASVAAGPYMGRTVLIPRISLVPSDETNPIVFKRKQFPVRPAYAITINKSQGQSLEIVGLDLTSPCFTHGQLYVGMTRVTNPGNLHILLANGCTSTPNTVYPECLL